MTTQPRFSWCVTVAVVCAVSVCSSNQCHRRTSEAFPKPSCSRLKQPRFRLLRLGCGHRPSGSGCCNSLLVVCRTWQRPMRTNLKLLPIDTPRLALC